MMLSRTALPLALSAAIGSTASRRRLVYGRSNRGAPPPPAAPLPTVSIDLQRRWHVAQFHRRRADRQDRAIRLGRRERSAPSRLRPSSANTPMTRAISPSYVPVGAAFIPATAGYGRVHGTLEDGSFMVGYEVVTNQGGVAVYVGPDVMNHSLSPFDPGNPVQGTSRRRQGRRRGLRATDRLHHAGAHRLLFDGR